MTFTRVRLSGGTAPPLVDGAFELLREELGIAAGFPPEVDAEAAAAARTPRLPVEDATSVPFVTIDPPGSLDLDQALAIEPDGTGFRVLYAIADVAAFVVPGGVVDAEAHRRGTTLYAPDRRTPLHPTVLSEGAASLLAGQVRPAVLWTLMVDSSGECTDVGVRRALVRSREQLTYEECQRRIEVGAAEHGLGLLRDVGGLRQELEVSRGAVNLSLAEQEVRPTADGGWTLEYRAALPVEEWNAQISLMTGMAAARLMLDGGIGILRTLPAPDEGAVSSLRRSAAALGVGWPADVGYAQWLRGLDPASPAGAALATLATVLLRGAGYVAFDGTPPEQPQHSAVAAPYAHTTAPLRRLVDRYVSEACLALCAGVAVPGWVRRALPVLPEEMTSATRRASGLDQAVVDLVEVALLERRVGEEFDAVVVEVRGDSGVVQIAEPAVRGRCSGRDLPLGSDLRVRLVTADPQARRVEFAPV